jgi:hypothetical protein
MTVPDWATSRLGSRARVALWLMAEVGVGETFKKAELRAAFPAIEQVDRRMRSLREDGWVIATYREDVSLSSDELRLVTIGAHVWEDGYQPHTIPVSARDRRSAFARDSYLCRYCGISAGEQYPDDPFRTSKLSAAKVATADESSLLLTLCDRCLAGRVDSEPPERLMDDLQKLSRTELVELCSWIRQERRDWTATELLWARFRRLPATAREKVESALRREVEPPLEGQ